ILYWTPVSDFVFGFLGAAMPLLIGGAIAFVLNIMMSNFEKWYFPKSQKKIVLKTRRPVCLALAVIAVLAIISLVSWLVFPELVRAIMLLLEKLPTAIDDARLWISEHEFLKGQLLDQALAYLDALDWEHMISTLLEKLSGGLGDIMGIAIGTVSSVFSWVVNIVIALIFACYLLASKETLLSQYRRLTHRFFKDKWRHKLEYILRVLGDCFRRYTVGQCVEACILGVLCTIGMWIFGFPYATMIGALIAFTALIPVAGAYIGGAVGAIMVMTESPIKAVFFVVFLIVLQQIEGNLIYPRVVGSSMGLPGIWVLAAVVVGGGVGGVLGMRVGVPFAAAVYRIIRHDLRKFEAKKKREETGEPAPAELPEPKEAPAPIPEQSKAKKKKKS
ncbi:MAG: AI-2E family transporter, partial [Clostridia bacterium]|nr:AI-2E family transporter [Clostridia bacterium]